MTESREPSPEPDSPGPVDPDRCRVGVWGRTDRGRRRSENQDAFLIRTVPTGPGTSTAAGIRLSSTTPSDATGSVHRVSIDGQGVLLVVADGMGGPPAGDVASELALAAVDETFDAHVSGTSPWAPPPEPGTRNPNVSSPTRPFDELLQEAVRHAHTRIQRHVADHPDLQGMGTTLTALLITPRGTVLAHVGDSRAYRLRDGELVRLTRDQTVAGREVHLGRMTEAEARRSAQSHILLQAVGAGPAPAVETAHGDGREGDRILVCSDGLSGVLDDPTIARILGEATGPREACDLMIRAANEGGGPDNVTAVVAHVMSDGRIANS